jgi:hypothetical protein
MGVYRIYNIYVNKFYINNHYKRFIILLEKWVAVLQNNITERHLCMTIKQYPTFKRETMTR